MQSCGIPCTKTGKSRLDPFLTEEEKIELENIQKRIDQESNEFLAIARRIIQERDENPEIKKDHENYCYEGFAHALEHNDKDMTRIFLECGLDPHWTILDNNGYKAEIGFLTKGNWLGNMVDEIEALKTAHSPVDQSEQK